ncbi:hypothetical protein H8S95_05680 [Pontibacter sp. KCTC 32443]|uniref:hypothetical protein n=1 Tax=Pontibacter TaxID=323449 RepID=UPI00164D1E8F|nr:MULTISPECIES: hypothetical protein [Pontibacter]MBC5773546.1 hypothetical protein [Pontibacter sp. KCTC 32443]
MLKSNIKIRQLQYLAICAVLLLTIAVIYIYILSPWMYPNEMARLELLKLKSHQQAILKAQEDFNNSNYRIISWGLMDSESPIITQAELLKERFNIQTIYGGCIRSDIMASYDSTMRVLTTEKFGKDTLNKTISEAIDKATTRKNSLE